MTTPKIKRKRRPRSANPRVPPQPNAIAFTIAAFQSMGGPGRTSIYALAKTGALELFRDPLGRTLVTGKSARAFLGVKDEIAV
jgi:hypothetical protein